MLGIACSPTICPLPISRPSILHSISFQRQRMRMVKVQSISPSPWFQPYFSVCLLLIQSRLAVHDLLSKSWAANAEVTLKLIFCLRSIHDGKSEKNTFYHAFGWLYKHHPRTAIGNLPLLVAPIIDRPPKKAKKVEGEDREDESDDWTEVEKEELQLPGYSHGKPSNTFLQLF